MMKLALGTVQFGLDYGISNQHGQVSKNEVFDILAQAHTLHIDTLDCAGAYGNSEKTLGDLQAGQRFNIVSKIPALSAAQDSIMPFFTQSLADLKCDSIDTLLFHQADNLLNHPHKAQLFAQIEYLKAQQLVNNIGVSLYSPEQLLAITNTYVIDKIQVPINVFDQRFISNAMLQHCVDKKLKVHARSLFLQGLLFIEHPKLNAYFIPYKAKLKAFDDLAQHLSCSKLTLALALLAQDSHNDSHSKAHDNTTNSATSVIEKIVVGICNTKQLTEIVSAYQKAKSLTISTKELHSLADLRLGFINPSLWQL